MTDQNSIDQNGGGGGGDSQPGAGGDAPWYSSLPDELKGNPTLARYTTLEDAARGIVHYAGHFGVPNEQLVRLPKPDDAEAQAAFWNKLGRPEAPDGYQDVALKEGSPLDKDALSGFLAHMHKSGPFTPQMAKEAVAWYEGFAQQQVAAAVEALKKEGETAMTALKGEWGQAYDAKFGAAMAAAKRFGGEDLAKYVDESGIGNDPRFIKAWDAVAEAIREAGPPPGDRQESGTRAKTPAEVEAELTALNQDPEAQKALADPNHPNHGHYVQKRLDLFKMRRASASA